LALGIDILRDPIYLEKHYNLTQEAHREAVHFVTYLALAYLVDKEGSFSFFHLIRWIED
jgi:hypothetical protein